MIAATGVLYMQRPAQGYHITVFHSMHAEVDQYRTHHWQVKHFTLQLIQQFTQNVFNTRHATSTAQSKAVLL